MARPFFWRCIPCGATSNISEFCWGCGRHRAAATDPARWRFTLDAVVAAICPECGERVDRPATVHMGCCSHPNPSVVTEGAGICSDCGAGVYLEHDDDRVYWEIM